MKKRVGLGIIALLVSFASFAQRAEGKITVNGASQQTLEGRESIIHHFGDFKTGKHSLVFELKTSDFPKLEDGKEVAIVQFETIVKVGGKEISRKKSSPLPFFPGEMGMPLEAFEVVSPIFLNQYGLEKSLNTNPKLTVVAKPKTRYDVEIRASVLNGEGKIAPTYLVIIL